MITLFRSLFAPPRHLILILVALWLGLSLAEKGAIRHDTSKEALNNLVFYSILGYAIGGRLLFALANLSAFRGNPLGVFSINVDLFDSVGALATACIVGFVYAQRQKLALWPTLDALTPFFATLAIGLSLSHLAAGTAFGKPTNVPWAIDLWNAKRHPTQIYELVFSILIFGMIWLPRTDRAAGADFLLFAALTAGARVLLEAFRGDSALIFGTIRLAQVIAWLVLAAVIFISELMPRETNSQKGNPPLV
jgi:phosphatidylglycerol:prolipoprotein diacylglycerol transferase